MSRYYEREDVIEQIILHLPFAYEETESIEKIAVQIADSCTPVELSASAAEEDSLKECNKDTVMSDAVIEASEMHAVDKEEPVEAETIEAEKETEGCETPSEDMSFIEMLRESFREEQQKGTASVEARSMEYNEAPSEMHSIAYEEPAVIKPQHAKEEVAIQNDAPSERKAAPLIFNDEGEPPARGVLFPVFDENGRYCADKCSNCKEIYPLPHEKMNFCSECGADFRRIEPKGKSFNLIEGIPGHKWID